MQLKGKTALITGASSGLGRHFAHLLAREGARVIAAARRVDALAALSDEIERQGGTCIPIAMDVTDPAAVAAAFEQIERSLAEPLSIVVNNAGVAHTSAALDLSTSEWEQVLQPNLTGAFLVAQHAARMMRNEGGTIVNIASTVATMAINDRLAYSTSKGGVLAMTYSVAKDHLHDNIRCNAILPGRIHTPFVDGFIAENYPDNQAEMFKKLSEYQPIGRMGTPAEVGAMAVFLCSDEASFITGAPFPVDGGTLYVR